MSTVVVGTATSYDGTTQDLLNSDEDASLANTLLETGSDKSNGETAYFTRTPSGALVSMRVEGTSYYYITNYQGSVICRASSTARKAASEKRRNGATVV